MLDLFGFLGLFGLFGLFEFFGFRVFLDDGIAGQRTVIGLDFRDLVFVEALVAVFLGKAVKPLLDFGLLVVNRRSGSQAGERAAMMMRGVVIGNGHQRRLGRVIAHVVPAEILEPTSALAEALRPHCRPCRAFARKQSGRQGCKRLGFACH